MRESEIRVLNELKKIINEVGFDENLLEYGATFKPNPSYGFVEGVLLGTVIYFVKLKNSDEYILKSRTIGNDNISYLKAEALREILTNIKE